MTEFATILGLPVVMATSRAGRPNAFGDEAGECPFCPGAEAQTPPPLLVVPRAGSWDLRVVPNLYPIIAAGPGGPRHEVVIETPDHDDEPSRWTAGRARLVVGTWIDRLVAMRSRTDVSLALMFRNQGGRGGASLPHPHSHIAGLPELPASLASQSAPSCAICADLARGRRILAEMKGLVAWCPAIPAFPWEIAITSRIHTGDPSSLVEHRDELAALLRSAIHAHAERGLGDANWILRTSPRDAADALHWTLSLHPRVSGIAGYELATASLVNVVDADTAWRDLAPLFSATSPTSR